MNLYQDYLKEIEFRKLQGLHPKPIDGAELLSEIIEQVKDVNNTHREESLNFFIYNVLPGTTSAADVKAKFLKEIILGESVLDEITPAFAFVNPFSSIKPASSHKPSLLGSFPILSIEFKPSAKFNKQLFHSLTSFSSILFDLFI